jgi:hypothetical protein
MTPRTIPIATPENRAKTSHQRPLAPRLLHDNCQDDPGLAAVIAAWPNLSPAARTSILALIAAAGG